MTNNAVIDFPAHTGRYEAEGHEPDDNAKYSDVSINLKAEPQVKYTSNGREYTNHDHFTITIKAPGREISGYLAEKLESDADTIIIDIGEIS